MGAWIGCWELWGAGIDEVRDADERVCLCCVQQKLGKQVKLVRDIVREIAGVSPLERRGMELLKNGRDKRVLKLCKKRVRYIFPSHHSHPFSRHCSVHTAPNRFLVCEATQPCDR